MTKQGELDKGSIMSSRVTTIKSAPSKALKAEQDIIGSNARGADDKFAGMYTSTGAGQVISPPYDIGNLLQLVQHNNTLSQCVEAMEVNIDGTGHDIMAIGATAASNSPEKVLEGFFKEPYPEKSMVSIRRAIRRDIESVGNGFMEVMRNAEGKILMLNHIPAVSMRLGRLSSPVKVKKELVRGGKPTSLYIMVRERTYVQVINTKAVYFAQYGTSRVMNKKTGEYKQGAVPYGDRATEIIHFTAVLDGTSPYGVPRWINQLPSILGSRKAEEHNLDFFNSGGLPPVLITISGGTMVGDTKKALEQYLNGTGESKHRAAILEAYASGTSLDSSGSVKINVERFGAEKQNDSMFENYDSKCEVRTRGSFRLPELYVGKNTGNFAASRAASMLAEAQVFNPERLEFDTQMNMTIMKELAGGAYKFVSKKNTPKDGTLQMKGIAVARSTGAVSPESIVKAIAEVAGVAIEFDENELNLTLAKNNADAGKALIGEKPDALTPEQEYPSLDSGKGLDKTDIKKMDRSALASVWAAVALDECPPKDVILRAHAEVEALMGEERDEFLVDLGGLVFPDNKDDLAGAGELACTLAEITALSQ